MSTPDIAALAKQIRDGYGSARERRERDKEAADALEAQAREIAALKERISHWQASAKADAKQIARLVAESADLRRRAEQAERTLEERRKALTRASLDEALEALQDFLTAFRNRGETTSLHVWHERMKASADRARAVLAKLESGNA